MNGKRWLGLAAAATAILGGIWIADASNSIAETPVAVAGKLAPCDDGSFSLDAEIRDLASGQTLVRPSVRLADGARASVKIEIPGRKPLRLAVEADRTKNTATIELARLDGESTALLSRFDVRLR
jgi:hypothetical protein